MYRKLNELHYFASDLNKWISKVDKDTNGKNTQTINNIDCIQMKWIGNTTYMRIIESKHYNDHYGQNQDTILNMFSSMKSDSCIFEVYTIFGDYPYDKAILYNHITKETKHMNQKQLIDFVLFRDKYKK